MNTYEQKKKARIERIRDRADKKREFAKGKDLSMFGEEKSGIPIGQPILVGHHSEQKHRKHLERINNTVRKGYEALDYAETLDERANAAENRTAIDSDNPEAMKLLKEKIDRLKLQREEIKKRPHSSWELSNLGANIRRLEKRMIVQEKIETGFEPMEVMSHSGPIGVELVDGQIQVEFGFKPDEETRGKLKRSPLALKWSNYSKRWVRKHTESTASNYFRNALISVLKDAKK